MNAKQYFLKNFGNLGMLLRNKVMPVFYLTLALTLYILCVSLCCIPKIFIDNKTQVPKNPV